MARFILQLQFPEPLAAGSMGGFSAAFPFVVVPEDAVGTPLQSVSSVSGHVTVKITGSLLAVWKLPNEPVLKIMAFVLRGHVAKHLTDTGQLPPNDTSLQLDTYMYPGPCPFDIQFLEELPGSPEVVPINRPIGFVHGA